MQMPPNMASVEHCPATTGIAKQCQCEFSAEGERPSTATVDHMAKRGFRSPESRRHRSPRSAAGSACSTIVPLAPASESILERLRRWLGPGAVFAATVGADPEARIDREVRLIVRNVATD